MKYITLFLCSSFLLFFRTAAQVVTVSEELVLRTDVSYDLIGKLKGQYLLFQNKNNYKFSVQAYDEDLKVSWEKDLELDKRRPEVLGIVHREDHFYVVYQHRWKSEMMLKAHQYDAGANLVDSATITNLGFVFADRQYDIVRSDDRSKMLIFNEENSGEINVYAFDFEQMKFLWKSSFQPESLVFSRDPHQIVVTNEGEMYYIILKNNYRSRNKDHLYQVFYQDGSLKTVRKNEISLGDKLTNDVYFEYDNLNNQLVAGGLYGEKNLAWAKGYFLLKIPRNAPTSYTFYFHEFEEEFVNSFLERDAPSKNKGIFDTQVQEIVLRRDGGILMVAERVKTNQRNYGASTAGYYSRTIRNDLIGMIDFYYEHMLVISIHPDGERHWENVLRKKQYSQDDGAIFSSYFLQKTPSSLNFMFNDEVKEENTVSEYIIRGNGDFERHSVMSTENQKLRLRFREAVQTGAKEMLIPSERRNRLKLVRVSY
ncbi:MAG: hypothetical protein AAF849_16480 [Bacteroidota bacterium]